MAIMDPAIERVDAAYQTSRWDAVPELVDTDTGVWRVTTAGERFVFDMNARTVSQLFASGAGRPLRGRSEALDVLLACPEGQSARWRTRGKTDAHLGSDVRRTAAVKSIVRIDDGPGDAVDGEPPALDPTFTSSGMYTVPEAAAVFDVLVENVASREDRIVIATGDGPVRLIPLVWFDYLRTVVAELVDEISDAASGQRDAGEVIHVGESVVELRDDDTGVWMLTLAGAGFFIMDLDRRRLRQTADPDEIEFGVGWVSIARIRHCRVGEVLDVDLTARGLDWPAHRGQIVDVKRLDPWSIG